MESSKDLGKAACIFSEANITAAFKHIRTEKVVNEDGDVKEVAFTSLWLNDPEIKCFNKLDFIPYNGFREEQTNKQVYNLFTGYNPKILTPYNKDKKDIILKPFKDLWLELCGGNPEHFKYVYNFLAHMIQKPNEKIPICIIIKGKQGTGKNVGLKAFGNIIGGDHFISSANPNDFFGEYAEGFYHKLLVNMNECEGKDTCDFEGKIKAFISEDTITINAKHVRPSHIRNIARTIIFTNKPNPIPIDVKSTDRRYCVFQTTDKFLDKKYGTKFWVKLVEHFNKPEFIACLYDDLNTLDIKNVDWRTERPITEAYKEMCKLYVPVEALFLEHYMNTFRTINSDSAPIDVETIDPAYTNWFDEITIKTKDVYDEYSKFCKSNGFSNDKSFQPSISKFNNRLSELEIPKKNVKTYGINEMRFTPKTIYDHLVKKKWIARDEKDPEIVVEDFAGEDFEFEI
jgi:phage/plasmid-associated DNA primase